MNDPVLALTLGDPVGIGPEIVARTLAEVGGISGHRGVAVGDAAALRRGVAAMHLDVEVREVDSFSHAPVAGVIDIFDTGVLGSDVPEWGKVDARAGQAAITAIEVATKAALQQQVAGIVTGPINKEAAWESGQKHLGHTELLGELTGVHDQDTMFVVRKTHKPGHQLRVFFATRHVSLRKALDQITKDRVKTSLRKADRALRVFGTESPRLAVAALNPHGGEGGAFGDEEIKEIGPAVEELREEGLEVAGPIPADSIFHQGLSGKYDGILSLYHDQGHIPTKTFDFDGTISVTVGLPILRTSVDHGTAFDIAGKGVANHGTMLSAYLSAVEFSSRVPMIREAYSPKEG